jgi:death on curing protein
MHSLVTFLKLNGYNLMMTQQQAVDFTVDVVNHHYHLDEIVSYIRENSAERM